MAQPVPNFMRGSVSLKPAQEIVLASLEERDVSDLVRSEYEEIAGVSRSQAAYDIAELVTLGILERIGSGRSTRYRLSPVRPGRPRKWTDERIRAQLTELHATLGRWPQAADFRAAGRADLYLAACRNGGLEHWIAELAPKPAARKVRAVSADSRTWLAYALVLTACLGALTVAVPGTPKAPAPAVPGTALADEKLHAREAAAHATASPRDGTGAVLVLTARKDASLTARRGSAAGRVVFDGVLERGASVRVAAARIWVRFGAPSALRARLDHRPLRLPRRPGTYVVTAMRISLVEREPPRQAPSALSGPSATPVASVQTSEVQPAPAAEAVPSTPQPDGPPAPDPPPRGPTPDPKRPSP